jgi:leucyl/phenylalanyl-tRNA--protein transferase
MKRITWLSPTDGPEWFPAIEEALDEPAGLLAAGGDLAPQRLLAAYRRGIFPWYSSGQPILWWAPDPREVLLPGEFRRRKSLEKAMRNRGVTVTFDRAFEAVIDACAAPRDTEGGSWITPEMRAAYVALFGLGFGHSIEAWREERLIGGIYGVGLGGVFFGESMFSRERDASKIALAALVESCPARGIELIDCQLASAHLRSLGSRALARTEFSALLARLIVGEKPQYWT